jgi:hypothetical protein
MGFIHIAVSEVFIYFRRNGLRGQFALLQHRGLRLLALTYRGNHSTKRLGFRRGNTSTPMKINQSHARLKTSDEWRNDRLAQAH